MIKTNKPGTAQVGTQLKAGKCKRFLNLQKETNVEISSTLQCQQMSEMISKRLENYVLPKLGTAENPSCSNENLKKLKKNRFFFQT